MTILYEERVAHVRHACAWDCGYPIRIGERYVKSSVTPDDSEIGNTRWWHHALHGHSRTDCPDYADDRDAIAAKGVMAAAGEG